jgi:hypothetical protein
MRSAGRSTRIDAEAAIRRDDHSFIPAPQRISSAGSAVERSRLRINSHYLNTPMNDKLNLIREKCIAANPEIKTRLEVGWEDPMEDAIRLADCCYAMDLGGFTNEEQTNKELNNVLSHESAERCA